MRKNMRNWCRIGMVGLLLLFAASSCEREGSKADEITEESGGDEEREHYYSPYYLNGEGDLAFSTISFTDVGLQQPEAGPVEPILLEAIAESLAYILVEDEDLNFTPSVSYDEALLDPASHLFCEDHHLYIALWRGYEPERWGYSLWSGCDEYHEFAWEEVLDPFADGESDLIGHVEPLTSSIVESLKAAHESGCYTAQC